MMYPRLQLAGSCSPKTGSASSASAASRSPSSSCCSRRCSARANVVATLVWANNLKGRQLASGGPAGTHEYILCFARNAAAISQFRGSAAEFRELMPPSIAASATGQARRAGCLRHQERAVQHQLAVQRADRPDDGVPRSITTRARATCGSARSTTRHVPGYLTAMPHPNARPDVRWHAWRWSRARSSPTTPTSSSTRPGGRLRDPNQDPGRRRHGAEGPRRRTVDRHRTGRPRGPRTRSAVRQPEAGRR